MNKIETINISGEINNLFSNVPSEIITDELLISIVNSPIMYEEKVVGIITDYSLETGLWYGRLWGDMYPSILENHICSVEIK